MANDSLRDGTIALVVCQVLVKHAQGPQLFALNVIFFPKMWPAGVLACLIQLGVDFLLFLIRIIVIYICDHFIMNFNSKKVKTF